MQGVATFANVRLREIHAAASHFNLGKAMAPAKLVSTVTLVCTTLFMCGLASLGTGGILDACNQYSLAGTTKEECRAGFAAALGKKPSEQTKMLLSFALVFPRIEASLFLAMGLGGVYGLAKLAPGTASVAVIHLMQGIFFLCACMIHLHNSKLLPFETDPNLRADEGTWVPFAGLTGLLAALSLASFALCSKYASAPIDHVAEVAAVKEKEQAVVKLQAGMRAKKVREEETMRKRRSSVGSADI